MRRIIVAITGASGAIYGLRALELLQQLPETHAVVTPSAQRTIAHETTYSPAQVREPADHLHHPRDIGAAVSSGSFITSGMLVAPCSMKTLSGIANSCGDELVVRAADVCLKERQRVVILLRETPFHAGHIDLMARATANGAIIMPPVPAFYAMPATVDDIVNQSVSRALELLDITIPASNGGMADRSNRAERRRFASSMLNRVRQPAFPRSRRI